MAAARQSAEVTLSAADIAARWSCGLSYVNTLRQLGERFGPSLHPTRGGLWANFKLHAHARRYRAAAVEAHEQHMGRLEHDPAFVARQLDRARALGETAAVDELIRRLARLRAGVEVAA